MFISEYDISKKKEWDSFVEQSKNGTFLFKRDYLEYHRDRFIDVSLMIYDEKNTLLALFIGNKNGHQLLCHQGLTYGGFVFNSKMTQLKMLEIFKLVINYLVLNNYTEIIYKTIPKIYHQYPSDEDLYALFRIGARLIRRDSLTVIDRSNPLPFQKRRERMAAKGLTQQVTIRKNNSYEQFWIILSQNLMERYHTNPVHSLEEIKFLSNKFPENIHLYECLKDNEVVAGVVIYESDNVAHFQYISSNDFGRNSGALDYLFNYLIKEIYAHVKFIDFGISNEEQGRKINKGLIEFKEGFGGRTVTHDIYQINLNAEIISLLE
jgi:hypothetical protein